MVVGEPQRAFYGNQHGLTFPVFTHYGVQLWVPEVGGPIDPESEAHDLVMSVFGGMSKGERSRIRVRVRAAMSAQAQIEGRFLGGRPPYGYGLADAGPHPNLAKAADGKRLHRLEPDPVAAPIVERIFAEYVAGRGMFAIAEALTRDGIASPSTHDAALVATWTADIQACKAEALARKRSRRQQQRMARAEIKALVDALGNIYTVLSAADPNDKAEVYRRLNLRLTYQPEDRLVRAETKLNPWSWGHGKCPRADLDHDPTVVMRAELELR